MLQVQFCFLFTENKNRSVIKKKTVTSFVFFWFICFCTVSIQFQLSNVDQISLVHKVLCFQVSLSVIPISFQLATCSVENTGEGQKHKQYPGRASVQQYLDCQGPQTELDWRFTKYTVFCCSYFLFQHPLGEKVCRNKQEIGNTDSVVQTSSLFQVFLSGLCSDINA